jgi:hypothetical protein
MKSFWFARVFFCLPLLLVVADASALEPAVAPTDSSGALFEQAMQAELDGDSTASTELLTDAIESDPDFTAARWHSGQVQFDGQWLSLQQAETQNRAYGKIAEYRNQRTQLSGTLAGEFALAQWCHDQGLFGYEEQHWRKILLLDPSNAIAQKRLGLINIGGQLVTPEQAEEYKKNQREAVKTWKHWMPRMRRWRREIERASNPTSTDAWQSLLNIEDAGALPVLMQAFDGTDEVVQNALVGIIDTYDNEMSTECLIRFVVSSPYTRTRTLAAEALGKRSWVAFIPTLLMGLGNPLEYRYQIHNYGGDIFSSFQVVRENADTVVRLTQTRGSIAPQIFVTGTGLLSGRTISRVSAIRDAQVRRSTASQVQTIQNSAQQIESANRAIVTRNDRIYDALQLTTGQSPGNTPQEWWDWWYRYVDYEIPEYKREIELAETYLANSQSIEARRSPIGGFASECFAAGTPVWIETGCIPIEEIQTGDLVLSQDAETGELGYQAVEQTTTRPSPTSIVLKAGDDEIVSTPGHPYWIIGQGWRMAKQLHAGDRLYRAEGSVSIEEVHPGETFEAYNLIVRNWDSYFVGNQRLLVHDGKLFKATKSVIPGWKPATQ